MEEEERRRLEAVAEAQHHLRKVLDQCNRENIRHRMKRMREEQELDMKMVSDALTHMGNEDASIQARKKSQAADWVVYLAYLKEQRALAKQHEADLDVLREAELQRVRTPIEKQILEQSVDILDL